MGLLTVNAAASGRRRSFRMQRRHSPSSLRDGFAELPSSRRGTPQSETSELTLTPKKKDRKWTLSGLFRRRKNKSSDTENSSSLEETPPDNNNKHKSSFLKRKLSLKKKPSGSRKVVGKFDFQKNTTSKENHGTSLIINRDLQLSGNSSEKLSSLNSSSLSSKQKFDSLTLLQTGSSCGSLNSSGKRSSKNDVKARVEAEHEKLKDSSSDDEHSFARKYHSQDNINDSLKRRSRAARTERYLKRLNQINNLPFHQQAELLRMLDRTKINMKHFVFEPQTHSKAQSANSSLTNSPLPNIKFTFCPSELNNSQNNFYVNIADEKHKVTKSYSKPSPILPRHTLRQIDLNSSVNSVDDKHIYMNVASPKDILPSKVPPVPPPRDLHRKVICTYSNPCSVNFQQRPVSYAFEAPKFTSVDNLAHCSHPVSSFSCVNGNYRSNSEQRIGNGSIYSPTNDRPASVLQFATDIDYSAAPTDYQYITDQKPRSRRPIQIECNENQSDSVTNNLKPNNRLYFSDQHINSYRLENGSNSRSTINSSEEQVWKLGGKLHQPDSSAATTLDYNRNSITDSQAHFQFNKANKIDHNDLEHNSDHAPNPAIYLSRRNSKEIGLFVRPLSMVLEKSESEVESIKPPSRTCNLKSVPPDPPVRKIFNNAGRNRDIIGATNGKIPASAKPEPNEIRIDSVNSVDIDELLEFNKRHNPSYNLDEALNELEEIYKSLQLSDDDLLDRAERRDIPAQLHAILSRDIDSDSSCDEVDNPVQRRRQRTRSLSTDRKKDDMAYRRIFKTDNPNFVPKLDTRNIMSQAGSFLLVSPTLAPPVFSNLSDSQMSPDTNEPDVMYDDVVFRSIKHVNNSLKTLDPQPPFGIPVGPTTQASSSDYLHAIPEDRYKPTFSSRKTPDVVKDDLAFRNLRKDLNQNPGEYRKKRAVRSLSANLSGVLSRAEKLKYSFPHPLSYARSSSYNDLPNECFKEYRPSLQPSLSQLYSTASTESLTDHDVSEFLRHTTPTNYEELLRKFNSKFESSVPNGGPCPVPDVLIESNEKSEAIETKAADQEGGNDEVKGMIEAIENNKLNKTSLQQKKIIQHKPIVLSAFNSTFSDGDGSESFNLGLVSSVSDGKTHELDDCFIAGSVKDNRVNIHEHHVFNEMFTDESNAKSFDNPSVQFKSTKAFEFTEQRNRHSDPLAKSENYQQSDVPKYTSEQKIDLKYDERSKNDPKKHKPEIKKERSSRIDDSRESKKSKVNSAPIDVSSSTKFIKSDITDYDPKPTSTERPKDSGSLNEKPKKMSENKQNSLSKDVPVRRRSSKSKEISKPNSESNSAKAFELKPRRHSKIDIPEKLERSKNEEGASVNLKSSGDSESNAKSLSSKSPKLKKKRISQIENPPKNRESNENLTSTDILVLESNYESNPKLKSSKSPKLKKKRLSQIEIIQNNGESKDNFASSDILNKEADSKSSSRLEHDPSSKSAKSPKLKKKRLGEMGVSEKFKKSMEHLASSYAVDQETILKVNSSGSEGDSKVKLVKSPKSKKKQLSQLEIAEKSNENKESVVFSGVSAQESDLKSNHSSERDPKTRSSKSPKVRRKRSSLTESPEKQSESKENLVSDILVQEMASTRRDSIDHDLETNVTKSPKSRRKRSSQIDIPEIFRKSNENLKAADVLVNEEDLKSAERSRNKEKRPSKIEIPEIFKAIERKSVSNENLALESNTRPCGQTEWDPKVKSTKCSEFENDRPNPNAPIASSTTSSSLLHSTGKKTEKSSSSISEDEPQKSHVQPLKSILKKSDANTDRDVRSNKQKSSNMTMQPDIEKSAEDSGVVIESFNEYFLTLEDSENILGNIASENETLSGNIASENKNILGNIASENENILGNIASEISKTTDFEWKRGIERPFSPFFKSELSCPIQSDQNSVVTNSPVSQNQTVLLNSELEKILKKYENSISNANGGFTGDVSEELDNRLDSSSDLVQESADLISSKNPSLGACFDDSSKFDATQINNGQCFTASCRLESSCDMEPELNDKNEIVSALSELTSRMTCRVTDSKSGDQSSRVEECQQPEVTKSTKPISELPCTPNQKNSHSSVFRNQGNQLLVRKSPKAARQTSYAKSSSSCSDFEGIALSTSSLLAASYCFACLLQSDYLSLVNLMAATLVIVACFVLYHVLATE